MTDKPFAAGLFAQLPSPKAPAFVKLNLSFRTEEFIDFLKRHTDHRGFCRITIKESKNGTLYGQLDNYTPENTKAAAPAIDPDSIPF
jgi:hypothetical protein